MDFNNFDGLMKMVKGKPNRVVVPGANNAEALEAIKMADDNGLISGGILIGPKTAVEKMADEKGLNIKKFELIDCNDAAQMCALAVDKIVQGQGDFLVKGLVDTKYYMKAILHKDKGMVPEGALLSHLVLYETTNYHKMFGITDAAIMISPDIEQKAKIIQNSVDTLRLLGVEQPKVSVVCPIEKVNEKIPSTMDAAILSDWSREGKIKNAVVEGPYDIYITFSKERAAEKGIVGKQVPGETDLIILPDLDAANPVYKTLAFFGAGVKAAAIVTGSKIPIILPSRADAPEVKLNSIALCSYLKMKRASGCTV